MSLLSMLMRRSDAGIIDRRVAIIDIGSNSVRLVVYDGPARAPFILFNEKVMAGLGAGLGINGLITQDSMDRGLAALSRFAHLCHDMDVADIQCVATAAVRDAANGHVFVEQAAGIGLSVRVLSGEEEGRASAHGVLSAIPDADGIMGDLGGGSLELVRIGGGRIRDAVSLPLGVLRVREIRAAGDKNALDRRVRQLLRGHGWVRAESGLPFYLVGGSWRSLARLDMQLAHYPLPILHQYEMAPQRIARLVRVIAGAERSRLKAVPSLTGSRIPTLPDAVALLNIVARHLQSSRLIVSAYGLREGLLYERLSAAQAMQDPLLVAARVEGDAQGRFIGHGDLIERWIAPLFSDDRPALQRIRHAACLLADVGWRANPEFRAERGLEFGLHGNWVAITAAERALLGQALFTSLGGGLDMADNVGALAPEQELRRAQLWGLAIRLCQRLSGGAATSINQTSVALADGALRLSISAHHASLLGEVVERRGRQLAQAMGLKLEIDLKA